PSHDALHLSWLHNTVHGCLGPRHSYRAPAVGDSLRWKARVRLRRLLRMGVGELAGRSRQEALKRLERAGWATGPALRLEVSLADWQSAARARFFQGAASAEAPPLVAAGWPAACEDITRAAEQTS